MDTNAMTDPARLFAQTLRETGPTNFTVEELCQLYQFHVWCIEWDVASFLLACVCVIRSEAILARLQSHVVAWLEVLQDVSHVQEEVPTNIGYNLDAVVVISWMGFKLARK